MKPPPLTLCVICSTDSGEIGDTLESLGSIWTDCVVLNPGPSVVDTLDTGDRPVRQMAQSSPIRAQAYRLALDHVSDGWALLLDAGEVVTPDLREEIERVMGDGSAGAGSIRVQVPTDPGLNREQREVRLVRGGPRSHRDLWESVHQSLHQSGQSLVHLQGTISGHLPQDDTSENLGRLEESIRSDPMDLHAHLDRLDWARHRGDHTLWRAGATEARAMVEGIEHGDLPTVHAMGDLLVRISQVMPWVQRDEGREWLDQWQDQITPSSLYQWWRGHLREASGDLAAAESLYRASLQIPSVRNVEVGAIRPLMGLGRLCMARGDLVEAQRWTNEVLDLSPRDAEALLSALTLTRQQGGQEEVERFVASHEQTHGHVPELWVAVGQDASHRQEKIRAIEAFARAAGDPPQGRAALRLARALLVDGRPQEALEVLEPLEARFPEASLGSLACHLCLGRVPASLPGAESAAAHYGLRDWIVAVLQSRSETLVNTLIGTARQVAGRFPWLIQALTASAENGEPNP